MINRLVRHRAKCLDGRPNHAEWITGLSRITKSGQDRSKAADKMDLIHRRERSGPIAVGSNSELSRFAHQNTAAGVPVPRM